MNRFEDSYRRFCRQLVTLLLLTAGVLWAAGSSSSVQDAGRVRVETRDRATGQLVAARVYLTDLAGAPRTPPDAIAYDKRDEHHFVATGGFELELPSGDYRLVVERGTEYLPASADLAIRSGQTARHTIWLNRWIDMNRRRWYSGDLHNHRRVEEIIDLGRPAPAAAAARFFLEWIDREIGFYAAETGFRDPRHREEMLEFFRAARAVYARVAQ